MDYYDVLGVERSASGDEVKKAFKKKAMKYHPDRTGGDKASEDKFKEAKEAYDVLSDPQKKSMYDQYGTTDFSGGGGGQNGGFNTSGFGDVFEDIFGDVFGGGQSRNSTQRYKGADLEYEIQLTLEEAAFGIEKSINIRTKDTCGACSGTGAAAGSKPVSCSMCNGVGQVRAQQGFFTIQQTCPTCSGKGSVISSPCSPCRGSGAVNSDKKISVTIPAGVDKGDRIRLSGKGEAGINQGPSGDLFIRVNLLKHSIFKRDGSNLYCEVPVSFAESALGAEIEIPTLSNNKVSIGIPAGTQTGKYFRLKGKGIKSVRGGKIGDLMCSIHIETPVNLSEEQKNILMQFDDKLKNSTKKHSPKSQSWVDGLKSFFK
jgi:molecular chaperone DnaJ